MHPYIWNLTENAMLLKSDILWNQRDKNLSMALYEIQKGTIEGTCTSMETLSWLCAIWSCNTVMYMSPKEQTGKTGVTGQ